ncbi:MAG: polysaccharide deacetylase family protein [Bryobacteraceae bacterium]|nr:polysaccharide deacetylase family protein [Bryobacteraceae bacterium]
MTKQWRRREFLAAAAVMTAAPWPEGRRGAVSLTFDDARPSQLDPGMALLEKGGARATFYVSPQRVRERTADWKAVLKAGHEIGNHTKSHPCTGNYAFSRKNALETFDLARMERDLDEATAEIKEMLGVTPESFAYPCGQTYVGRGEQLKSYIPLVAKRFVSGRGYLNEAANDPGICDLAYLMGTGYDQMPFTEVKRLMDTAAREGRWLILVGHDMGAKKFQSVEAEILVETCRYANDPANGLWLATVGEVARHVAGQRKSGAL